MNSQLLALQRFAAERAARRPPAGAPSHVLVVAGGKGGVGTSLVTALLARAAARELRVLLLDADPGSAAQHLILGVQAGVGVPGLRAAGVSPRELMVRLADNWDLLSAGEPASDPADLIRAAEWRVLMRRAGAIYPEYDAVYVDAGSRLETVVAALEAGAGRLLLVTEPGRLAAAATYALFKVARSRFRSLPVEVLVNRADPDTAREVHEVLHFAARRFLGTSIALAGAVPSDANLAAAVETGLLAASLPEEDAAVAAARGILARWVDEPVTLRLHPDSPQPGKVEV